MCSLRDKAKSGVIWTFADRFGVNFAQFFTVVAFARLLTPEEIGRVALVASVIAIGQTVLSAGLCQAIIQNQHTEELHFDTAFSVTVFLGLLLYLVGGSIFFLHSRIAQSEELLLLYLALGVTIITNAIGVVHKARLNKSFQFEDIAKCSVPSVITAAGVSVLFAFYYRTYWAIVLNIVLQQLFFISLLLRRSRHVSRLLFSASHFRELWGFSWRLQVSALINTTQENFGNLLVAHSFDFSSVGYFARAKSIPRLFVGTIVNICEAVTFPIFSSISDDPDRLLKGYRESVVLIAFVVFPLVTALVYFSYDIILIALGHQWIEMVPYFQVFAAMGYLSVIRSAVFTFLKVNGMGEQILRMRALEFGLVVAASVFALKYGLYWLVLANMLAMVLGTSVLVVFGCRMLGYGVPEHLKDFARPAFIAVATLGFMLSIFGTESGFSFQSFVLEVATFCILTLLMFVVFGGRAWSFVKVEIKNRFIC